jgi:acetylornithine deacetylase/succinyl-diaminopimelate desuccinylase-like protein
MDVEELLKKLISINSITGREHEIADFAASYLDFAEVEMQNVEDFGPNVIARNITDPGKPIVILNCHMDTVEVMQGWDIDPFTPTMEGNRIRGLGACDMKAGMAIAMDVFKRLHDREMNVILTLVSDEEGNSEGAYALLEKILKKELGNNLRKCLCLIPEDTQEEVKLGARGRYVIEITVTGCSAHGATPECGVNAIEMAARIVQALPEISLYTHPQLGKGSLCVLKIAGGGNSLSVPDTSTIRADRHTVIGETKEIIRRDIELLIKELDLECRYELSWMKRRTPFLEPYLIEPSDPWVSRFLTTFRKYYNAEPTISYGRSVGDFNLFGACMPTIVFGPRGGNAHGPSEYVDMDSVIRCRDLYMRFLDCI